MNDLGLIVLFLLLWVVVAALLAPLETLTWWAGWYKDDESFEPDVLEQSPLTLESGAQHYVDYLTGISGISGHFFLPEERNFLDRLAERLPEAVIVDDIYPYAVTNRALTGQRTFAWFWRLIAAQKERGSYVGFLINIRNLFQVLVAADNRYGPIYSHGSAELVLRGLARHGYPLGSGVPVTLIGYSGGGEMALGAVSPLKSALGAPIYVVSLGGVMSSDPCLVDVDHLHHLYGSRDFVQRLGLILFPARWPLMKNSTWNQTLLRGRISYVPLGSVGHNGQGGYLDDDMLFTTGTTYLDHTLDHMVPILQSHQRTTQVAELEEI
jgi:hypothetical protein